MNLSITIDKSNIPLTKKELDACIIKCLTASCERVRDTARKEHKFETKSGKLERAIKFKIIKAHKEGIVYIDKKDAKYSTYVHEPTGMFKEGGSRYPIRPKSPNGRLVFFWKRLGRWVTRYSVMHTGSPADRFLYEALEKNKPFIIDLFREGMRGEFR